MLQYPDYYEIIKNPLDLSEIFSRLRQNDFYRNKDMMKMDLIRMTENCKKYNPMGEYYEAAQYFQLEVYKLFEEEF